MSNKSLSCVAAIIACAVSIILFTGNTFAGGDLIIPRERVYDVKPPVQTWTPKRRWSGFYVGGGLGIQQLKADIGIESRNKYTKVDWERSCILKKVPSIIEEVIKKKKTKKIKKWVFPRCGKPYKVTKKVTYWVKKVKKTKIYTTEEFCKCEEVIEDDNYDFSHQETASSEWKAFGTIMIGLDKQFSNRFVGGIFANIDIGSNELDYGFSATSGPTTANVSGSLSHDHSVTVGARLGYLLNEKTLAYGLVGYTHMTLDGSFSANISHTDPNLSDVALAKNFSQNVGGVTLGVGAEHQFTPQWSARLEYRYTWLGGINGKLAEKIDGIIDNEYCPDGTTSLDSETTFDIDPNLHSVRAVVSYKFNQ